MALWIRDRSTVPQEGWIYPGLNGFNIRVTSYGLLYPKVVEHYQANQQPVPSEQEVIDWLCSNVGVPCVNGNEPLINRFALGLASTIAPSGCCSSKK